MKVRVLGEQEVHSSQPDRHYLASGEVADIDAAWAKELLNSGQAEPIAEKASSRAEKRPAKNTSETR